MTRQARDERCVFHPLVEAAGSLLLTGMYEDYEPATADICAACMACISPMCNANANDPREYDLELQAIVHVAHITLVSGRHSINSCPLPMSCRVSLQDHCAGATG